MNAIAAPATPAASKAAWICLAIAWACFLLPIPGIGLFIGWPLNLVAFILAIVAMAKRGAMSGLWQLLASLIASPIVYFIGLAVLAGSIGAAAEANKHEEGASSAAVEAPAARMADALAVDARALHAAYSANEVAADQQYKGKLLRVSGTVEAIDSGIGDEPNVRLSAGDFDSVLVKGLPAATAASLAKDQQITVVCKGAGEIMGSPVLDECATL